MKILALDLGKFKLVSCCFDTEQQTTEFWTLDYRPHLSRHGAAKISPGSRGHRSLQHCLVA